MAGARESSAGLLEGCCEMSMMKLFQSLSVRVAKQAICKVALANPTQVNPLMLKGLNLG
jgi:hypothetical protein